MNSVKDPKPIFDQCATKSEYRMKLLGGNNVVLVERNGYDSEVFMPQIMNGRITFQNVIPSRRGLYADIMEDVIQESNNQPSASVGQPMRTPLTAKLKGWKNRLSAGYDSMTPSNFLTSNRNYSTYTLNNENNCSNTNRSESMFTLPTPELERFAPNASSSLQLLNHKFFSPVPNSMRAMKFLRESASGTPSKLSRFMVPSPLTFANNNSTRFGSPVRQQIHNFSLPCTPDIKSSSHKKLSAQAQGTVTKWRKCLTPVRTYVRRRNSGAVITKPGPTLKKVFRVVPTFLVNPTQAPRANSKLEIRKRKLIVDTKKAISPASFKKQQQQQSNSNSRASSPSSKLVTKRKHFESKKVDAKTLMSRPSRTAAISAKLSQQFNKACYDRVAASYPKYRLLCTIPPLNHDTDSRVIRNKCKEQSQQTTDSFPVSATVIEDGSKGFRLGGTTQEGEF